MAKKKQTASFRDRMPNRKYVTVTWAAASTTAVYTQFDTMMGAREGAGWIISRVDVQFKDNPPPLLALTTNTARFQLATGAQTTPLSVDDDEVIANLDLSLVLVTTGAGLLVWPISWIGPILVASRELTCSMDAKGDAAPFQSVDMLFTIFYQWIAIGAREWVEIAEARGIA